MFLIQFEKSRRAETANTSRRGKEIKGAVMGKYGSGSDWGWGRGAPTGNFL